MRRLSLLFLLPALALSAPALDASSAGTAAQTATFSWTHTPSGTPSALFVIVGHDDTVSDIITSVTYNGVGLTEHASSPWCDTTGGSRCAYLFYSFSPASGAQTVQVNRNTSSVESSACAYSFTGADQIQDLSEVTGDAANPSDTLTLSSTTSVAVVMGISGLNIPTNVTALSGWTADQQLDNGASSVHCISYDTVGTSDVTSGWTSASDFYEVVSIALSESSSGGLILRRRRN
jgi:hypothetical protein